MKTNLLTIVACSALFALTAVHAQTASSDATLTADPVYQNNCAKCHGKIEWTGTLSPERSGPGPSFHRSLRRNVAQIRTWPNAYLFSIDNKGNPANCGVLGFHTYIYDPTVTPEPGWIFTFSSWISPGLFGAGFQDVTALWHETSEAFNDPFGDTGPYRLGSSQISPHLQKFARRTWKLETPWKYCRRRPSASFSSTAIKLSFITRKPKPCCSGLKWEPLRMPSMARLAIATPPR